MDTLIIFGVLIFILIVTERGYQKRFSAIEDLLGGIGVCGEFCRRHENIFNHAIALDEKIELLTKKIDALEREKKL